MILTGQAVYLGGKTFSNKSDVNVKSYFVIFGFSDFDKREFSVSSDLFTNIQSLPKSSNCEISISVDYIKYNQKENISLLAFKKVSQPTSASA